MNDKSFQKVVELITKSHSIYIELSSHDSIPRNLSITSDRFLIFFKLKTFFLTCSNQKYGKIKLDRLLHEKAEGKAEEKSIEKRFLCP